MLNWDRFQFAFTITYHYIFPQLTMGLILVVFVLTAIGESRREERYARAASGLTYCRVATEAT